MERLPPVPPEQMTDAQRAAVAEFEAMRGTAVFGPFAALLRSPEVMVCSAAMGDYVRFRSVLPRRLSELGILITARHWTQQYQWAVHAPIAIEAGVPADTVRAIAEGRRPDRMSDDEMRVYDFFVELNRNQNVSDDTYARALERFGEQGIVDLLGIAGHYTFLSMVLNTARTALPGNARPSLTAVPGGLP